MAAALVAAGDMEGAVQAYVSALQYNPVSPVFNFSDLINTKENMIGTIEMSIEANYLDVEIYRISRKISSRNSYYKRNIFSCIFIFFI